MYISQIIVPEFLPVSQIEPIKVGLPDFDQNNNIMIAAREREREREREIPTYHYYTDVIESLC